MVRKFLALAAVASSIFGCSGSDSVAADDGHIASGVKKGTMTDPRDGQVYKTVKIGTQTWMAENLNYPTYESYCYDNEPVGCQAYGRLYTWSVAMNACPSGWHLPNREEFETLLINVGADEKERSNNLRSTGWKNGADRYGFSALPAGYYLSSHEEFGHLGYKSNFWSSTEFNSSNAYNLRIYDDSAGVGSVIGKHLGYSVRCLQD